jgi:ATP-binding cassette subfamily E protein 1
LDSEQRVRASKVMKRWIINSKRSAFVVEHDFIMATYLADKVIVFDGIPAKEAYCTSPEGLVSGMNKFLKLMDITFRRDPTNFRPRINKLNSQKDQEQKAAGNYFLMEGQIEEEKEAEKKAAAAKKDGKTAAADGGAAEGKAKAGKEEEKESKPKGKK